jgi:hypothetical protein
MVLNKIILVVFLGLFLAACQSTGERTLVETVFITPPDSVVQCERYTNLPNPETLTNQEVSNLIIGLYTNLETCAINMDAIRDFIRRAEASQSN